MVPMNTTHNTEDRDMDKATRTISVRMVAVFPEHHRTTTGNPMFSLYSPHNAFARNYRGMRGREASAIRRRIGGTA
jgi:hypothetical protein